MAKGDWNPGAVGKCITCGAEPVGLDHFDDEMKCKVV